jgi:hypothetical protein
MGGFGAAQSLALQCSKRGDSGKMIRTRYWMEKPMGFQK